MPDQPMHKTKNREVKNNIKIYNIKRGGGGGGGIEKGRKKERKKVKISRRPRDILFWSSFFYLFACDNLKFSDPCAPLNIAIMFLPTNRIRKVLKGLFQDPYFLPSSGH